METLAIDIETYSGVPLQKAGVYRYVEAADFEVLIFGYSADGGSVRVVDLAGGESIPKEALDALTDEGVVKWAFNANFERVCLSRFLGCPAGEYLDPRSWHCSMVWAATLGLERQKLTEDKELVRYFCQPCAPTKANGGRRRSLPADAPEKWASFKGYTLRDVEVELSIEARLAKFPVPDSVWDEYHHDQEINDRGVALDMEFVRQAIQMDERSRGQLTEELRRVTALENLNSVQQMKRWLAVVEKATAAADSTITFSFRNGSEITV